MAVALDQPLLVVCRLKLEQRQADFLHGVQGPDPEQVSLERADEAPNANTIDPAEMAAERIVEQLKLSRYEVREREETRKQQSSRSRPSMRCKFAGSHVGSLHAAAGCSLRMGLTATVSI